MIGMVLLGVFCVAWIICVFLWPMPVILTTGALILIIAPFTTSGKGDRNYIE